MAIRRWVGWVLTLRCIRAQFDAQTSVFVDEREMVVMASAEFDDFSAVGRAFCERMGIDTTAELRDGRPRCAVLVADELADSLYCNATARAALDAALAARGARRARSFRFYHGTYYYDSEEYELLRELLLRQGHVECLSGERLYGGEDVVWLLGHFDEGAAFYGMLSGHQVSNAMPNPTALGNKDRLVASLEALRGVVGDRAVAFLPRSWLPAAVARERAAADRGADLGGLWLRKDPAQELGAGIALITRWEDLYGCDTCMLQRYVDRPFLLTDPPAGVFDAKFSFGVYLTVSSVDPLEVWLHRETLVLLATYPYEGARDDDHGESGDLLTHLTNGLLNQRLAGDDFDAAERVWTTDRLLDHVRRSGHSWPRIEDQVREIATMVFVAARDDMLDASGEAGAAAKLFSHWRLDFLLDEDARAWLLEVEIVPSTGTIGGVDEVIKTTVLRDVLALNGVGGEPVSNERYPWLRGEECWVDADSAGNPPNRICATADAPNDAFGDAGDAAAAAATRAALAASPLRRDPAAARLVAEYEARRHRAGGYRPLLPAPRSLTYFDGSAGAGAGDELAAVFRSAGATPADLVLDAWAAMTAAAPATAPVAPEPVEASDPFAAAGHCAACAASGRVFCATVAPAGHDGWAIGGACQGRNDACLWNPDGLVDGVPLADAAACAFDADHATMAALLQGAKVAPVFAANLGRWCGRALREAPAITGPLSALCRGGPPPRATVATAASLGDALLSRRPAVLRNVVDLRKTAAFAPAALAALGDEPVVAMAYDETADAAQRIFSAPMPFGDFLKYSANASDVVASLPRGAGAFFFQIHAAPKSDRGRYAERTALYLLLTDRHRVEDTSGTIADPNGASVHSFRCPPGSAPAHPLPFLRRSPRGDRSRASSTTRPPPSPRRSAAPRARMTSPGRACASGAPTATRRTSRAVGAVTAAESFLSY